MPPTDFIAPSINWFALSPLLTLVGGALAILLLGALTPPWPRGWYATATAITAGAAGVLAWFNWLEIDRTGPGFLVEGALSFDVLGQFITLIICGAVVLVALISDDAIRESGIEAPEVYGLYLLAASGAVVMALANDLIVLFIGLESLSLALYVLAASARRRPASQESGLKYFVLGGFASALFLYGVALVYGGTGSTNLSAIIDEFQGPVPIVGNDMMTLAGIALIVVGFGFKMGAIPFHQWVPDVYQGAPSPVTAFLGSIGKAAAFGAVLRVLVIGLPFFRDDWGPVLWVMAALSLIGGPILAVIQRDVKRMVAYSSIGHVGFMLAAVEATARSAGEQSLGFGMPAVVLYLLFYGVITIGTLGVITVVARSSGGDTSLAGLAGLNHRQPLLAVGLTVLLFAQAGVPFTTGFIAKFGVIWAAVESGSYVLAVVALVAAVIAAFVYLRIMVTVWMGRGERLADIGHEGDAVAATTAVRVPLSAGVGIGVAAVFTVVFGVAPMWFVNVADAVNNYSR